MEYINGALTSLTFLKPRDERLNSSVYWKLFEHSQKNKIQKWEEMTFYIEDDKYGKMKLILNYFGEKNAKNCGQCSVCERNKQSIFGKNISHQILNLLSKRPSTIEELSIQLSYHSKENILERCV